MITRAQMPRQLRDRGGIMTIKTVRQKYGLGDFVRKIIPNELAKVAEVAAPFIAPFNPVAGAIAGGLGRYDRTGDLGSSLLYGGATFGLGKLSNDGFGQTGKSVADRLRGRGFDLGSFGKAVETGRNVLVGRPDVLGERMIPGTKGLFGAAGEFGLKEAIGGGKPGIFLGTTALSLLGQKLVGPKKEDESEEEYLQRRKTAVSNYLRRYYSNLNPTASSTDVEAFVQRNTVDYKAEGGRIGFDKGGIMDVPVRTNSEGVKELDYRKTGGFVPIGVKEKADDVPAMLSLNEFVMTADAVRGAGDGSIEKGAQRMYDTMKKLENRVA